MEIEDTYSAGQGLDGNESANGTDADQLRDSALGTALARLRAAADERFEVADALHRDAALLREQLDELIGEPKALAEEISRLREELRRTRDQLNSPREANKDPTP